MDIEDFEGVEERFKCRKCEVLAESSFIDRKNTFVRRPCCENVIRGQAARNMFAEYAEYEAKVEFIQNTFARRPWLRSLPPEELHKGI